MASRQTRNSKENTDQVEYPDLSQRSGPSDTNNTAPTASELLLLQANINALQQAQVTHADKQSKDTHQLRSTLSNIEEVLTRLASRDESRGRSQYRSVPPRSPLNADSPIDDTSHTSHKSHRFAKVSDPQKLTDGVQPTFESWEIQLLSKLDVNADHYATEKARMYYVYSCTDGDAQKHLYPRFKPKAADPFVDAEDMIEYLSTIFCNPHRTREARYEYQELFMGKQQSFHEFKTIFIHLADEAQIPHSERFDDLYDKLTTALQTQLLSHRTSLNKNFHKLCELVTEIDGMISQTVE